MAISIDLYRSVWLCSDSSADRDVFSGAMVDKKTLLLGVMARKFGCDGGALLRFSLCSRSDTLHFRRRRQRRRLRGAVFHFPTNRSGHLYGYTAKYRVLYTRKANNEGHSIGSKTFI